MIVLREDFKNNILPEQLYTFIDNYPFPVRKLLMDRRINELTTEKLTGLLTNTAVLPEALSIIENKATAEELLIEAELYFKQKKSFGGFCELDEKYILVKILASHRYGEEGGFPNDYIDRAKKTQKNFLRRAIKRTLRCLYGKQADNEPESYKKHPVMNNNDSGKPHNYGKPFMKEMTGSDLSNEEDNSDGNLSREDDNSDDDECKNYFTEFLIVNNNSLN